jgi:hypothetical protein
MKQSTKKIFIWEMNKLKIVILTFSTIYLVPAKGQIFTLKHFNENKYCSPDELYYKIQNKAVLKNAEKGKYEFRNINLISDSIIIKRINDSIFTLRPLYENVNCKIYFIDKLTNQKVDSIKKHCGYDPFIFEVSSSYVHDVSYEYAYKSIKKVYLLSRSSECYDYAKNYSILSYDLVMYRNDSTLLKINLKDNQFIPLSFKKKMKSLEKTGDLLYAENIILSDKEGQKWKIGKRSVFKIQ